MPSAAAQSAGITLLSLRRCLIQGGVIALFFAFYCWINFPGHLNYDTLVQLIEGRTRVYQSVHPPLMSALLGLSDFLVAGTGLYLVLSNALFFGAFLLLCCRYRFSRLTWIVLPLVLFCPVVLLYQGVLTKDVLFSDFALLGFCLIYASSVATRFSMPCLLGATLSIAAATMIRQQGPVILIAALYLVLALPDAVRHRPAQSRHKSLRALAFLGMTFAEVALLNGAIRLTARGGPADVFGFGLKVLEFYDIAGIVSHAPDTALPILKAHGVAVEGFEAYAATQYSPARWDGLATANPAYADSILQLNLSVVTRQWINAVREHPIAYAHHKLDAFRYVLGLGRRDLCVYVHPIGVSADGPAAALVARLHLTPGHPARQDALLHLAWRLRNSFLYYPAFYLCLSFILTISSIGHRLFPLIAAINASVALYALTFLFVSVACDFRYMYFLVASQGFCLFAMSLKSNDDPASTLTPPAAAIR